MLFGPAVEHATYVFLAPSLAAAFLDQGAWPRGRWLIRGALLLVMGLGWGSLTRALCGGAPLGLVVLPLGTALFAAWLFGWGLTLFTPAHQPPRSRLPAGWPGHETARRGASPADREKGHPAVRAPSPIAPPGVK
jgi:hypothetical protein